MKKQILILQAASDICKEEIQHILATASIHNMEVFLLQAKNQSQLEGELKKASKKFDYIYLCAHANHLVFGEAESGFEMSWLDFGTILCNADCINDNCIFLLACCRTGLNQVAYDLLYSCYQINFICGPSWKLRSNDMTVAFDVFI